MNYRILAALILSVASLSVQAETRWFEVELLVFERKTDLQSFKEQLSSEQIIVDTNDSINIVKSRKSSTCIESIVSIEAEACLSEQNPTIINSATFDSQGNNFQYLPSSRLQLVSQRQRLANHAGFNPVFHMAWRMPVHGPQQSKPLHLFAGQNFALKQPSLAGDKWAIDGNFKIYLNHFLYIDSQVIIRKEVIEEIQQAQAPVELINDENGVQIASQFSNEAVTPVIAPTVTETKSIKQSVIKEILFDQNRRLRSEEIHYLDHPLMGIIVQIRKI